MEWIPQGVADPNPKKYELSRAEKELLREQARIQKRHELGEASDEGEEDEEDSDGNDEEEVGSEDGMDATIETTQKDESQMTASEIIASEKVDLSTLPADLRMDDYPRTTRLRKPMERRWAICRSETTEVVEWASG